MQVNGRLQRYPLLRIALFLIIGIMVGDACYPAVGTAVWLVCAVTGLAAAFLFRSEWGRNGGICFVTLALGAALISRSERQTDRPLPRNESRYEAVLTDNPVPKGKTLRCDLLLVQLNGQPLSKPIAVKATVLNDPDAPLRLQTGNGIIASSVLEKPKNRLQNPRFDYALWLKRHGYQAETFIPYWQLRTAVFPVRLGRLQQIILQARCFRDRIVRHFRRQHVEQQDEALLEAMVLGSRQALDKATREAYAASGGSHILALSGLHLGIIFSIFLLVFGQRGVGLTLSVMTMWAFTVLVGLPTSVVRSAVMLTIYAFTRLLSRQSSGLNALALAALVILVAHPMALWDVGFRLSFMAVAGILIVYKPLFQVFNPANCLLRWAWGMTCVSVSAQLFTFPLLLHYFGRFSSYFLLTNFVVIPAATLLLSLAFLLLLSTPFAALQTLFFHTMTTIAGYMNTAVTVISRLPCASLDGHYISAWQTLFLYVALFALIGAYRRFQTKKELERTGP